MSAVRKPATAIELARSYAKAIERSNADSYKSIAAQLVKAAEDDEDVLWDLAQRGADALANAVLSEMRQKRDDAARAEARAAAIARITPKNAYQRQAIENRQRQAREVASRISFNWLTSYTLAGVKLGRCRHVEIDRAYADCEKQSGAYASKAKFLAALRKALKDHKQTVGDVLTHSEIAKIALAAGYTRQV